VNKGHVVLVGSVVHLEVLDLRVNLAYLDLKAHGVQMVNEVSTPEIQIFYMYIL
jgi:hypothetical protein